MKFSTIKLQSHPNLVKGMTNNLFSKNRIQEILIFDFILPISGI